jgi:hypothetical protein
VGRPGTLVDMSEGVQVAVGQVWEDDDPRSQGRRIEIIEVDTEQERVRGKVVKVARNVSEEQVGRRTRWIRSSRFQPGNRGYRLVENPATGTRIAEQ